MNPLTWLSIPGRIAFVVLFVLGVFALGWSKGGAHVQAQWDAETSKQALQVAHVETAQAEASVKVVTQYVDRIRVVKESGSTLIKEIPRYVPSDACPLPGGFRLLHDAAARGDASTAPGIAYAEAVPVATAAESIAENYARCHANAEQLEALQLWIEEVRKAADN